MTITAASGNILPAGTRRACDCDSSSPGGYGRILHLGSELTGQRSSRQAHGRNRNSPAHRWSSRQLQALGILWGTTARAASGSDADCRRPAPVGASKVSHCARPVLDGVPWTSSSQTPSAGPLDGNNLRTRSFAWLLQRAGQAPIRFHSLRHAAAALLMAEGSRSSHQRTARPRRCADDAAHLRARAAVRQEQAAAAMDHLFESRRTKCA